MGHVHNVRTALGAVLTYDYVPQEKRVAPTEHVCILARDTAGRTARRESATRYGLSHGRLCRSIAKALESRQNHWLLEIVEDVIFPHPYGCSQMGDDQEGIPEGASDMQSAIPTREAFWCWDSDVRTQLYSRTHRLHRAYDEDRVKFPVPGCGG